MVEVSHHGREARLDCRIGIAPAADDLRPWTVGKRHVMGEAMSMSSFMEPTSLTFVRLPANDVT